MKRLMRAAAVLAGCALGATTGCTTLPGNGYGAKPCGTTPCATGTCATGTCASCGGGGGDYAGATGSCKDLYDPCWPERYNTLARRSVNHAMAPQVMNGHVLDQTVWN